MKHFPAYTRGRSVRNLFSVKVLFTFLALLSVPSAVVYTAYAIENKPPPKIKNDGELLPKATVIAVMPQTHQASILGHGEAVPHFALTLSAEVEGTITSLAPELQRGERLAPGQVLASLDPINYQKAYATAVLALAEANYAYQKEKQEAERAANEWARSGLEGEATKLLLRSPQLQIAKAKVDEAKAMLAQAEKALDNTKVKAPFEAVVVQRWAVPGQYVQVGDPIASLYGLNRIDVQVSLPISQWTLLPEPKDLIGNSNIELRNSHGDKWLGQVMQVDQHVDRDTRQRSLIVSLINPQEHARQLLPGMFLEVVLPARSFDGILAVPASSLSSRGEIWHLNDVNRLQKFAAEILFKDSNTLYLRSPFPRGSEQKSNPLAVLISPNPNFISGQTVEPVYVGEVAAR